MGFLCVSESNVRHLTQLLLHCCMALRASGVGKSPSFIIQPPSMPLHWEDLPSDSFVMVLNLKTLSTVWQSDHLQAIMMQEPCNSSWSCPRFSAKWLPYMWHNFLAQYVSVAGSCISMQESRAMQTSRESLATAAEEELETISSCR